MVMAQNTTDVTEFCASTKEYIQTLNFLRNVAEFGKLEKEARNVADKVSENCNGAAGRYIKVYQILSSYDMSAAEASRIAVEVSGKTEAEAETFIMIFNKSFSQNKLNLDFKSSMDMARKLAFETKSDLKIIRNDFAKTIDFCSSPEKLDLPKQTCAKLAAKLIAANKDPKHSVAESFIKLYKYLTLEEGANLTANKALEVIEEQVPNGALGIDNFRQAFQFAISKEGLQTDRSSALNFARSLASRTVKKYQIDENSRRVK